MKVLHVEKTASGGIAIGNAFVLEEQNLDPDRESVACERIEKEKLRFQEAVESVLKDLYPLAEAEAIFAAHMELVQDISLRNGILQKIEKNAQNAEAALYDTAEEFAVIFDGMEDEYMRERGADIRDIRNRLMRKLKKLPEIDLTGIRGNVILVARDLAPSDTAQLKTDYIQGFLTEYGGVTSHVAIMAKYKGIPAVVGVADLLRQVQHGDTVILDADGRKIYVNPDSEATAKYEKILGDWQQHRQDLMKLCDKKAITTDGHEVEVCANVGSIEEIKQARSYGADGIGLFRSEFLYMDKSNFPTEEEQFQVYKEAAVLMEGQELTIRTLDIGGDKGLPYFEFPKEDNPFLGYRAIRIGLDRTDILKTQLRALLRAGAYGRIRIMYPMIVSIEEIRAANQLMEECKTELRAEGKDFNPQPEVGIMVETPASVLMAEELAKEVDFFSIGTNDLTQYVLAVDRGNDKIASLYNPFHPAVQRAILHTIRAGHKAGIKVGMCGEFAGNKEATELLLGMGLDEFSMSASLMPEIKGIILGMNYREAQELIKRRAL